MLHRTVQLSFLLLLYKVSNGAVKAFEELFAQAYENPQALHDAPVTMPVGRPDETAAARNPILRYQFDV